MPRREGGISRDHGACGRAYASAALPAPRVPVSLETDIIPYHLHMPYTYYIQWVPRRIGE